MYFTPVKRLFIRLEAGRALGKRRRGEDIETQDLGPKKRKGVTGATSRNPVATKHAHGSAYASLTGAPRIALQHEDCSEDAIVITALDKIPFCCHEDLLTMSREKLQEVAASLNAKLPESMRIDVAPLRTDREMRKDIEVAVGITKNVPGAPKANKRRANATPTRNDKHAESVTPLSSPLASRSRIYGVYTPSPGLGRLDEADEEDFSQERQSKRRKVAATNTFRNEIDDVFTSTGSNRPHPRVLQNIFSASSLRAHPTQLTPYHNLVQAPSAQPRRKHRPTSQLVTSSSVAAQNSLLTPMQTSTPRKSRSMLRGSPLRSPLRSPWGNIKDVSVEDDPDAIALMSGMYGMRMCESYDGDFLDMDVDT